jgi:hypothetical protein
MRRERPSDCASTDEHDFLLDEENFQAHVKRALQRLTIAAPLRLGPHRRHSPDSRKVHGAAVRFQS